jgi:hypothetical protein
MVASVLSKREGKVRVEEERKTVGSDIGSNVRASGSVATDLPRGSNWLLMQYHAEFLQLQH